MNNLVDGQRQEDYGDPVENMELIAGLWSEYLSYTLHGDERVDLCGENVAKMMALLKVGRLLNSVNHKDSLDDFNGYIEIARRCHGE